MQDELYKDWYAVRLNWAPYNIKIVNDTVKECLTDHITVFYKKWFKRQNMMDEYLEKWYSLQEMCDKEKSVPQVRHFHAIKLIKFI